MNNCIQAAFSGGGGGGGAWTDIGSDEATSDQSALTVSGFTAMDILQIIFHVEEADSLAHPLIRINDVSTTTYGTRLLNNATVVSNTSNTGYTISQDTTAAHPTDCVAYIFKANSNLSYTGTVIRFMSGNIDAAASYTSYLISGHGNNDLTDPVTRIDVVGDSGDISGTLQVNGMDY